MNPDIRRGLHLLLGIRFTWLTAEHKRSMEQARRWLREQMAIDDRRRKPRGTYKRSRS